MTIGFAYGVFHAAGPGHGKAVIAGYLVASERALIKGFALSLSAALVQALVAIAIVSVAAVALHATAGTMTKVTGAVEVASFAAVAAIGGVLTWRKAGKFVRVAGLGQDAGAAPAEACDHVHLPPPAGARPADASPRARRRGARGRHAPLRRRHRRPRFRARPGAPRGRRRRDLRDGLGNCAHSNT